MGLDMYLSAEKFIGGYSFMEEKEKETYHSIVNAIEAEGLAGKDSPTGTVSLNVGYWRKQNAIHNWFVNNVQGGVDECDKHSVSRESLESLRRLCLEVLKDNSKAMELLPPTAGFFFGGTEIDEYYIEGLKYTVEMITKALDRADESWTFYYQSSW